jgi:hypothetical protein
MRRAHIDPAVVFLPSGSVIVLENTPTDPEVEQSLREHVVPAALAIRPGISWPHSQMFHVRVTGDALLALGDLIRGLPVPQ